MSLRLLSTITYFAGRTEMLGTGTELVLYTIHGFYSYSTSTMQDNCYTYNIHTCMLYTIVTVCCSDAHQALTTQTLTLLPLPLPLLPVPLQLLKVKRTPSPGPGPFISKVLCVLTVPKPVLVFLCLRHSFFFVISKVLCV
jgi:hypothetical protein